MFKKFTENFLSVELNSKQDLLISNLWTIRFRQLSQQIKSQYQIICTNGSNWYAAWFSFEGKINAVGFLNFYKYLSALFVNFQKFYLWNYIYVWMYLSMRSVNTYFLLYKSVMISKITNIHLASILKVITVNKISSEIEKLVEEKICQILGRKKLILLLFSFIQDFLKE